MKQYTIALLLIISLFGIFTVISYLSTKNINTGTTMAANVIGVYPPTFKEDGVLDESGNMKESHSLRWWLNSGGILFFKDKKARTIYGNLPKYSYWRIIYYLSNSKDTDNGYHPQNIFRLVTKSKWKNFTQEAYFRIIKNNFSESENRNQSNGLLLFNRYLDGDNLYYTGIRVDGAAVIKKKIKGKYFTMAYKKIFDGKYNRKSNPNLLPQNTWLGVKSEVVTLDNNNVQIKLFVDKYKTGNWELVLEAIDDGRSYGKSVISNQGYAGIRTDFMDVEFDDYKVEELSL